jgi:hypothetical protein
MRMQASVLLRTKMIRLGKEQNEICKFIIHLEVLIYVDIDFLCCEWPHM